MTSLFIYFIFQKELRLTSNNFNFTLEEVGHGQWNKQLLLFFFFGTWEIDLSFLESSETRKQEKNQIYNIENIENWKQLFYNIEWENQNLKTTVRLERYAVEANPSLKIPIAKNQKDP